MERYMEPLEMVRFFKAMGCKARLAIIELLGEERLCVGALSERLGFSQPAVSQHLRVLRDAGIVEDHRCGYHIHYSVNKDVFQKAAASLSTVSAATGDSPCSQAGEKCAVNTIVSEP
jgi:ArsR family transcriptional regulator